MARPSRDTPIIIRKKKIMGHGHHGGAWKVAFADFMTAMFALFLVLWLVNQSSDVKAAIANYFRDPIGFEQGGNLQLSLGGADSPAADRQVSDSVRCNDAERLSAQPARVFARRSRQAKRSLASRRTCTWR